MVNTRQHRCRGCVGQLFSVLQMHTLTGDSRQLISTTLPLQVCPSGPTRLIDRSARAPPTEHVNVDLVAATFAAGESHAQNTACELLFYVFSSSTSTSLLLSSKFLPIAFLVNHRCFQVYHPPSPHRQQSSAADILCCAFSGRLLAVGYASHIVRLFCCEKTGELLWPRECASDTAMPHFSRAANGVLVALSPVRGGAIASVLAHVRRDGAVVQRFGRAAVLELTGRPRLRLGHAHRPRCLRMPTRVTGVDPRVPIVARRPSAHDRQRRRDGRRVAHRWRWRTADARRGEQVNL